MTAVIVPLIKWSNHRCAKWTISLSFKFSPPWHQSFWFSYSRALWIKTNQTKTALFEKSSFLSFHGNILFVGLNSKVVALNKVILKAAHRWGNRNFVVTQINKFLSHMQHTSADVKFVSLPLIKDKTVPAKFLNVYDFDMKMYTS